MVKESDLLDAGMIFGTGFAPFTGGPLHYAQQRGHVELMAKMKQFSQQYGERFEPHPGWQRLFETPKPCEKVETVTQ